LNALGIVPIPIPGKGVQHGTEAKSGNHRKEGQESSPAPGPPLNSAAGMSTPASHAERMKIVAEDLQVPMKTAQCWITKFRKEGEDMTFD